jgi:hypothetical protein
MKVLIVFPPQWTAAQPYSGIATLNGELRRAGHDVSIVDLNVAFWEYVLEERTLRLSRRRMDSELRALDAEVRLRLTTGDESVGLLKADTKLEVVKQYLDGLGPEGLEDLVSAASEVAGALRDADRFYDPGQMMDAMRALDAAFRHFSVPFWPSEAKWNDFSNPSIPYNFEPMLAFTEDYVGNPFSVFLEHQVRALLEGEPDMVAVSVGSFSQVFPGLTLARQLRVETERRAAAGLRIPHLGLGGNFFSRLRESLQARPAFLERFCDSVLLGEGEGPIVKMANTLASGANLSAVPSLVYLDRGSGEVAYTFEEPPPKLDDRAFLDLSGFPLDRYMSPHIVACISASKGCYYGKCAFCDSHYGLVPDEAQVAHVVDEMRSLGERFGVRDFEFIDQCIAPPYMDRMCDAILEAGLDVHWFCNGRTEAGFTPALLDKMKRAGCTMVMWGVECASPRVLKLMRKGVVHAERMKILQDAADAGLWNFAYIFFGFPTETREEAESTIDLICNNTHLIHSYGRSVFTLGKHSPLMAEADRFGILGTVEDRQEFSTNLSYQAGSGLQASELNDISARCMARAREAYGDPLWMALRSRENLHLYLARHGTEWVARQKLRAAPEEPAGEGQPEFIF